MLLLLVMLLLLRLLLWVLLLRLRLPLPRRYVVPLNLDRRVPREAVCEVVHVVVPPAVLRVGLKQGRVVLEAVGVELRHFERKK